MQPEALAHLEDIRSAAAELLTYTEGSSLEGFLSDGRTRRAVERCIEICGEALVRIRRCDKLLLAEIPHANQVIGMRNIVAHDYGEVRYELIWQAAREHVPALLQTVAELIVRLDQ